MPVFYGGKVMSYINSFGVIGGDERQIALAESIAEDGYKVYVYGFIKNFLNEKIEKSSLTELIRKSDCIILPLPVTKDFINLNAPFSTENIVLNDVFAEMLKNKKIFCGASERLSKISNLWGDLAVKDYSKREEFAVNNAVPTAEGAIEIAMKETKKTINSSRCLISGFGRIGKVLAKMLNGLGADVTVSARKPVDLAFIKLLGYRPILTSQIKELKNYDIIFNTIPSLIFDRETLLNSNKELLIIDLASLPGGVDFKEAENLGIKTIHALALPGKVAPYTAGEIIKNTVYNMIKEEEE